MPRLWLFLTFGIALSVEGQTSINLNQTQSGIEKTSHQIDAAKAADAIRSLFGEQGPALKVEVLDVCNCPLATATIHFSISGTVAPPFDRAGMSVMWLGKAVSETGKSFPIWARASVVESGTMVVASKDLKYRQILQAGDVLTDKVDVSPLWALGPQDVASYVGKVVTRPLSKGQMLTPSSIAIPPAIARGEEVIVDIAGSGTHLSVKAEAQTSGNVGDSIFLLNPMSGRKFSAMVSGPGAAKVLLGPSSGRAKSEEKN